MTEAEEVAAAMLPDYLEYKKSASMSYRGHSAVGVRNYVMRQLQDTESYNVIDAVSDALVELVFPNGGPSPH